MRGGVAGRTRCMRHVLIVPGFAQASVLFGRRSEFTDGHGRQGPVMERARRNPSPERTGLRLRALPER